MTDNSSVNFRNKRDHQYVCGTQGIYYEVLSLIADRVILECRYRDISNRSQVSRFFISYDHFQLQTFHVNEEAHTARLNRVGLYFGPYGSAV